MKSSARHILLVVLAICGVSCTTLSDDTIPTGSVATEAGTSLTPPSPATTSTTHAPTADLEKSGEPAEFAKGQCRPDPFEEPFSRAIERDYPGKDFTAHVFDIETGCHYRFNAEARMRTASVFKVMVLAGTLLEAQEIGRPLSQFELDALHPMITESANWPVRALWRSFGSAPWFSETGRVFGLDQTSISADGGSAWGLTRTSAADQVELLRQVLLGHYGPLGGDSRETALQFLTSVSPEQSWGVTAGVPDGWQVALKNGFVGAIINSVGWVDRPGPDTGYLVAILTYGWNSHADGIEAVEMISLAVAEAMVDTVDMAQ